MTSTSTTANIPAPERPEFLAYTLACTGGYEQPSFQMFTDLDQARRIFANSVPDCIGSPGDRVDLVGLTPEGLTVVLDCAAYGEDEEDDEVCQHCTGSLDDNEGYDGYCGTCADLLAQHEENEHQDAPREECPDC